MSTGKKSRLSTDMQRRLKRIAEWGQVHSSHRKPAKVFLILILLWFYLCSYTVEFLKKKKKYLLFAFACMMCVGLLSVPGIGYIVEENSYKRGINELQEMMQKRASEEETSSPADTESETKQSLVGTGETLFDSYRIDVLQESNPDCVGWLYIPDTVIDYPIMQHANNEDYYLNRDFFGKKNRNGCLILDNDSSVSGACDNLIIHGHNLKSGAMFGSLLEYEEPSYGEEHNLLYVITVEEVRTYQLLAVFYSKVFYEDENVFKYYQFFSADTNSDFLDFYGNIKEMSLYDTGVEAVWGDKFLTLSTCAYHEENGRFVVVAKQIY